MRGLSTAVCVVCIALVALVLVSCTSASSTKTSDPASTTESSQEKRAAELAALADVDTSATPTGAQVEKLFSIEDAKQVLGRDDIAMLAVVDPG